MIKIQDMTFAYRDNVIYRNFSFLTESPFVVLKGPSGCGKTTLLKLISGNLIPLEGQIDAPARAVMVLQEDALFSWLTGIENISEVIGISKEKIEDHSFFDHLKSFIFRKASQMSYGQRRMVELFRALLYNPDLLCLDEPFNFLDIRSRNIIAALLKTATAGPNKMKIIMASHYQDELMDQFPEVYYYDGLSPINHLFSQNPFLP
ncbi:MAG: ATP-binding cassette domain-containing protein [Bacteroidetes bacterium]|nr:ATP-binding cassette domain-containing protein [Bacteroidota bacterium]